MWGGSVTSQQLQETIHRLSGINEVPGKPKENKLIAKEDPTRCMSISREREIASNLAFLSSTSDDPLKVTAICVEERRNGEAIIIRIAANTGDLSYVTQGLQTVAGCLKRAALREHTRVEDIDLVLKKVVALDSARILSRLRSRHAKVSSKTAGKPQLITQLNQALFNESLWPSYLTRPAGIKTARADAALLQSTSQALENIDDLCTQQPKAQEHMGKLVKLAQDFHLTHDLNAIFLGSKLNPSTKEHLHEAIGKLGHYYSATCELVCAARNKHCRLFKSVVVEPFTAQKPPFPRDEVFRVHAEIQLLFYYEQNPEHPKPRIICSSKSACFLCNLFLQTQGDFHIPRTHERLYEKWSLPDWLPVPEARSKRLREIALRFDKALNETIRMCLKSGKRPFQYPTESGLLPLTHYSSSDLSVNLPSSHHILTGKPQALSVKLGTRLDASPLGRELPLTPPTTPPKSSAVMDRIPNPPAPPELAFGMMTCLSRGDLGEFRPSVESISLLSIKREDLPFDQRIKLQTPSFRLILDKFHFTFDFHKVTSGHLSISIVKDGLSAPDSVRLLPVEDIPTSSDMQLRCLRGSKELGVLFLSGETATVCVNFAWYDAAN